MRKENKLTKVAIFALLIAIVAIVLVSGTYAKYTTSLTGTDKVQIAKWAWNISDADIDANTTTYTLDLFSTIKDTATYGTTNEAHVIDGKIAPGTTGEFNIQITNKSEVDAEYSVTFGQENPLGAAIEYSTDGGNTWGTVAVLDVDTTPIAQNQTVTVPVQWRWAFTAEGNGVAQADRNEADTLVGFGADTTDTTLPFVTVTATLQLDQVN